MLILLAMPFPLSAKVLLLFLMSKPENTACDLLVLVGHTAGGKTSLAAHLALRLNGEIISADSRQVYRGMDIGTGKDLEDYRIGETSVPYHLINIADAGSRYSLYDFQSDFRIAYDDIRRRGKLPILCGGTGLYVESVLKGYTLAEAPEDPVLRSALEGKPDAELVEILKSLVPLHNQSDIADRNRLVRAIEVAKANQASGNMPASQIRAKVFVLSFDPDERRNRITLRLTERLKNGMIDEVKELLKTVKPEDLMYYGLEYKYLTLYCTGEITYDQMCNSLNTAIHQFAKRQMTWFRGMERRGIPVNWIPGELPLADKIETVLGTLT